MAKVIFRSIERKDLELIRKWRNSPEVSRNMFSSMYVTKEQQLKWYKGVCRGDRGYCWLVESSGKSLGYASLSQAERSEDCYEFGLYIGNQEFIGGGYGSAILFNLLWEAFERLNAHKVVCEVLAFNIPAIKLYEKFGMQKQGYFKDFLKRENERIDCVSYAIFRQEWQYSRYQLCHMIDC